MRKNTARHWLHAGLDLLPLILIPVFMIYSHRHTIDSGSIDVPVNKVVDFNQNTPSEFSTFEVTARTSEEPSVYQFIGSVNNSSNHIILLSYYQDGSMTSNERNTPYFTDETNYIYQNPTTNFNLSSGLKQWRVNNTLNNEIFFYLWVNSNDSSFNVDNVMLFDLTKMFGVGNEPTIEQFNQWYPNDYYSYTLSHKELLKGYSSQTYDDTDIMSQFTYQLYNSVDKYFNMGNVFGMSNVYDWFNLNIFGGNASISIYIVWNIVLYEFVMDLLFLLYALFMWFIDVTKRLIEKPLDSIK